MIKLEKDNKGYKVLLIEREPINETKKIRGPKGYFNNKTKRLKKLGRAK